VLSVPLGEEAKGPSPNVANFLKALGPLNSLFEINAISNALGLLVG